MPMKLAMSGVVITAILICRHALAFRHVQGVPTRLQIQDRSLEATPLGGMPDAAQAGCGPSASAA